ncbi:MAG: ATP-binding protein [Nitrososphaerales archaeon]
MSLIPKNRQKPEPKGFPTNDTWLFYGPPKIGKTTLAAKFEDPLVIDLENGARHIEEVVVKVKSLKKLMDLYEELEEGEVKRFKTIVIDSSDTLLDLIDKETCRVLSKKFKKNYEDISEMPNGSGWAMSRKLMLSQPEMWKRLGVNVVFVGHSRVVMSENAGVKEASRSLDLAGKLAGRFPARIDNIGYCYGERKKNEDGKGFKIVRRISFQPYEDLEVGCRRKELIGKILPMTMKAMRAQFDEASVSKKKVRRK